MTGLGAEEWYTETLHSDWRQTFSVREILQEETTEYQHLVIFENELLGKVLVLDGVIQATEKDEFVYHEMMSHVPLLAHGNAKRVLVIGGGDGGILREVLRHQTVEKAVLVEIDPGVVAFSKKYLPHISQGSFDDPRVEVCIQDASLYVKETGRKFDVIICDSTDPVGPGAVLFTPEFYGDCRAILDDKGIFVNQNGVPFMQPEELSSTYKSRKEHFSEVSFYLGVIPTYVGGFMAFGWATNDVDALQVSTEELEKRLQNVKGDLKYYTPAMHKASFVLPKFIEQSYR
ncbi:MAG: polyamine aminopropyltransferase [Rhabdochlamydiaceae bacterium]|nr:polyamine aminopropyltransferase [Rhabdochlamydiaceae bacterium]